MYGSIRVDQTPAGESVASRSCGARGMVRGSVARSWRVLSSPGVHGTTFRTPARRREVATVSTRHAANMFSLGIGPALCILSWRYDMGAAGAPIAPFRDEVPHATVPDPLSRVPAARSGCRAHR